MTNAFIYDLTEASALVEKVRFCQLRLIRFLSHVLRMPEDEPTKEYALYSPSHGRRKPGRQQTLFLKYIQNLLGDAHMLSPIVRDG